MDILSWTILAFVVIETLNILTLYFSPDTRRGNGLGVFKAFDAARNSPEVFPLVQYLTNWVAGTKLIFVGLLVVIAFAGSQTVKVSALAVLILSILSFYWRLYPAIRDLDARGQIEPAGYSKTLGTMIAAFIGVFAIVLVVYALRGFFG